MSGATPRWFPKILRRDQGATKVRQRETFWIMIMMAEAAEQVEGHIM
jgi:hypothetical protein